MNKYITILLITILSLSCSQFNKGVISKKELRKKKPPSVQIAEEYDRKAKKNNKAKTYNNPEKADKARQKQTKKHKKKADKYVKRQQRKIKKNN